MNAGGGTRLWCVCTCRRCDPTPSPSTAAAPPQALETKLEREREALPGWQPAATPMSPGSLRILARRQRHALLAEDGGEGPPPGGFVDSGASCNYSEGAVTASSSLAPGGAPAFPFRPAITERAAGKPARSPEELHADWAAQKAKLVGPGAAVEAKPW